MFVLEGSEVGEVIEGKGVGDVGVGVVCLNYGGVAREHLEAVVVLGSGVGLGVVSQPLFECRMDIKDRQTADLLCRYG